jgi:uncharacterized protein (DUF2062 family)
MFKRRQPLSPLHHARELLWPSMGWRRAFKYIYFRIVRLSDTTRSIALGLSIGVAISCNPLLGTHFIQAGTLAWLFRANLICALIGTFFGNPWTYPFLFWAAIKFGSFLFRIFGLPASEVLPQHMDIADLLHFLAHDPWKLFFPCLAGGYVIGALSIPFTYVIFYNLIKGAKAARSKAKLRKMHKVGREVTKDRGLHL